MANTPPPSGAAQPPDINCSRAMQQLWDFLDQELTDHQMVVVRHHIESCSSCFPHKAWAERFLEALHSLRDEKLMPPEVKARVIEQLRLAGYSGASS
ncbi:MAG TPA: zf-HC2 domain-containing protein [Gemmatimonadaceae bacterium]|nr:zf-HC2 domain-containing protein [Gemmatimonadaceae bacterium]